MPRFTASEFIQTHHWLAELWRDQQQWFSYLTFSEQQALHDYFRLTHPIDEAAIRRLRAEARGTSLPQRAGRAAAKLDRIITNGPTASDYKAAATTTEFTDGRGKRRQLSVRSVVRPEIDYDKFAKALIAMAIDEAKREADDSPPSD